MKIAVDAMGGDKAPASVIEGTALALETLQGFDVVLVGHTERLEPFLKAHGLLRNPRVSLKHADEVVNRDEPATAAIRQKKNSSITVAAGLMAAKEVDALVSIGNTGAALAATTVKCRTLPGVDRPALLTKMPAIEGNFHILDVGANAECKPLHLAQFAIIGEAYARVAQGIANPTVGLLSVGDEDIKGNDLTKEAFKLISKLPINFIGNVEGNTMYAKMADVVVCDGFVGNVALKASEGLAHAVMCWMKKAFTKNAINKMAALLSRHIIVEVKARGNYEEYGGAPLLGVNGICVKGHGASSPKAVMNAIRITLDMVAKNLNGEIVRRIADTASLLPPIPPKAKEAKIAADSDE